MTPKIIRCILENMIQGKGYLDKNDKLVMEPFDFSAKQYLPPCRSANRFETIVISRKFSRKTTALTLTTSSTNSFTIT